MSTLRIPAFLELTPIDWLAATGRTVPTPGAERTRALAPAARAATPFARADAPDAMPEHPSAIRHATASATVDAAPVAPPRRDEAAPPASGAQPAQDGAPDASPVLQLRRLKDGRLAFALHSKVGAVLVSGESAGACEDPQAFARRVLEACAGPARTVETAQGSRLELGGEAAGLRAHSRPAAGAAHARALQRLIAVQAAGASIRIDGA